MAGPWQDWGGQHLVRVLEDGELEWFAHCCCCGCGVETVRVHEPAQDYLCDDCAEFEEGN